MIDEPVNGWHGEAPNGRRPIRVLYLASSLHYGGAERQIVELARRLDRSRFTPFLCCLDGLTTLVRELDPTLPVAVIKKRHRLDISVIPRAVQLISEWHIDIVHSFLFDAEIVGRLAGRLGGASAVIASERNCDYPRMPVKEAILKLTRPCFDLMIANSNAGRLYNLERLSVPDSRVRVVHNGVDAQRFRPHEVSGVRRSLQIPERAGVIGMFASFKPQKNHSMYVRVARAIAAKLPDTCFLFVGHDPSDDPVSAAHRKRILGEIDAGRLGDRCRHLMNRSDIEDLYCLCDLTLLTSIREGTPNVVLESLACGVPVIATDVADNSAIIGDAAGSVVPLNDDAAMAERAVGLLSDRATLKRMGEAARRRALDEFSLERLARKTEMVYLEALALRRCRPAARNADGRSPSHRPSRERGGLAEPSVVSSV